MGQSFTRLDHGNMGEVGEETTKKVNIPTTMNLGQDVLEMRDIHVSRDESLLRT